MPKTFIYLVQAHDPMFPNKPDVYLYGCGPSVRQPGRTAVFFGEEKKQAMLIEGSSQKWTKVVAESVAQLYNCDAPSRLFGKGLLTRAVQVSIEAT